jgi:hypothetical protein
VKKYAYVLLWLLAMNTCTKVGATLSVVYQPDPPFFIDQAQRAPTGIAVELIRKVLDEHGITYQFNLVNLAAPYTRDTEIHSDIQFFTDKAKKLNAHYYFSDSALITKKAHLLWLESSQESTQSLSSIAALCSNQPITIAIEPNNTLKKHVKNECGANISIIEAQDAHHAMALLKYRQVDYLLSFRPIPQFVSIDRRLVKVNSLRVIEQAIYVGVNKNTEQSEALIKKISTTLTEMNERGETEAMYLRFTALPKPSQSSVD